MKHARSSFFPSYTSARICFGICVLCIEPRTAENLETPCGKIATASRDGYAIKVYVIGCDVLLA
jgi:hypothetical protein